MFNKPITQPLTTNNRYDAPTSDMSYADVNS